jgi:hypothetical protein
MSNNQFAVYLGMNSETKRYEVRLENGNTVNLTVPWDLIPAAKTLSPNSLVSVSLENELCKLVSV